MNQPSESEKALSSRALATMDWLDKRDFRNLPAGTFIDFNAPAENMKRYEMIMNAGADGTAAMGTGGGNAKIQQQYMQDRFARDDAANFQDNVQRVAGNAQAVLGNTAGMEMQRRTAGLSALSGSYGSHLSQPKSNLLGSIIGAGATIGGAAISKW